MTPQQLIDSLSRRGVTLTADGMRITVTPAVKLSESELNDIRKHKLALLSHLHGRHIEYLAANLTSLDYQVMVEADSHLP